MKRRGLLVALLVVAFLALRIALLVVREPFFDELFTVWISRKSFAGILAALRFDSGPPLYYFVVHALGLQSVVAIRVLSLVFTSIAFALLIAAKQDLGAAFVAFFPASVLFAVDARAYAMCAMFIGIAALCGSGLQPASRRRGALQTASLILAAYTHWYGVLFFPLLWRRWKALAIAVVAFLPGLWLAVHQPAQARAWMTMRWPDALFVQPPVLILIAIVALIAATTSTWRPYVPLAAALIGGVYVPLRFESVLAPVIAADMKPRRGAAAALIAICAAVTIYGVADHAKRAPDDYELAAEWASEHLKNERIVATGYLYLPMAIRKPVEAFPAEQAIHPGWRALPKAGEHLPQPPFIWIGERNAPELRVLGRIEPVYVNDRAMVARIR